MNIPAAKPDEKKIVPNKATTLKTLLEKAKGEIEAALPKHLTPERMLRIAMTEARKNPDLLECSQTSFLGAIIQCAQLGLEPGGALGHAYLVPFNNRKQKTREVQFIVGYRGMIDLAGRSQRCSHVIARTVREHDEFDYEFGTDEKIFHRPKKDSERGKITHFYAIVFMKDGGKIFDVMTESEMQEFRSQLKPSEYGPWFSDYEAMAKKTVVRRLFKFAPVSIEIQQAVGLDEAGERGEQDNASVIEAEGKTLNQDETDAIKNHIRDSSEIENPQEGTFDAMP